MENLRKLLPYMSILVVVALLYAGWTIWSRHRVVQHAEEEAQSAEAKRDADITRRLGGGQVKIMGFYASPGTVHAGETALVCYSVSNAKSIRIEPFIEDVKPALSRCVEVHPKATTEYKLTAQDSKGHEISESFALRVAK